MRKSKITIKDVGSNYNIYGELLGQPNFLASTHKIQIEKDNPLMVFHTLVKLSELKEIVKQLSKPKKKRSLPKKTMKFGDMPQHTRFEDNSGRKMVKLQHTLPSGLKTEYFFKNENDPRGYIPFTAVDETGLPCRCPDHARFSLLGRK